MTTTNDRILDIRDKINSLEFCLNNTLSNFVVLDKGELLKWLDIVSDRLIKKTSNFRVLLDIVKKKGLEANFNNKITNCMSLALRIELLSMRIIEMEEIKVSQYVSDFIKDV